MSKRGDVSLRILLTHGARPVIYRVTQRQGAESWLTKLTIRRNKHLAAFVLANKAARTVRALLAQGREFQVGYAAA